MTVEMKKYKLGDTGEFLNGKIRPTEKGNYPVYGGNGILDYCNQYNYENVIIIGRVGAYCGCVSASYNKCWVSDNAIAFRPNDKNDIHYLKYLLTSLNLNKKHVGAAQPLMTQGILKSLDILLPELSIQKKIASVLSSLDKRMENLRAQNRVLEQTAKTIYDYTFLQCAGHKTTYSKFLNRNIPSNWEVKKLKEVCKVLLGGTPSTKREDYWLNGTVNWLNSGEVAEFPIIDCEKKITKKAVEKSSTVYLPKGSVTLSITRYLRPSILAIDACINQSVAGVLENSVLKKSYLFPMLKTEVPKLNALRSGAQQPHINKDIVENINVVIPSKDVLNKYYSEVDPIYEKILVNSKHLKELTTQRNTLLPLLMTGQVEVA